MTTDHLHDMLNIEKRTRSGDEREKREQGEKGESGRRGEEVNAEVSYTYIVSDTSNLRYGGWALGPWRALLVQLVQHNHQETGRYRCDIEPTTE